MLKKKSVQKRKMFTKKSGLDIQKEVRLGCSKKEVFNFFFLARDELRMNARLTCTGDHFFPYVH